MNIIVSGLDASPADAHAVEIVERKGLGHPDTLSDALAEEVSLALSRWYLDRFGIVLHHNVDKVLLRGGAARPEWSGGQVLEPIDLYLAGRATSEYRGVRIPVAEIAVAGCRKWLAAHMHALDPERHVRVHCLMRPGSRDLVELFARQHHGRHPLANDTSLGVGFAPSTPLERAVLAAERGLRDRSAPERGEDVKVMGVRIGSETRLTVACALIGRYVPDVEAYVAAKRRAARVAQRAASNVLRCDATVEINTADEPDAGSVYLTVTGTSAESGDDGQTGRGNRVTGLITPGRPMTLESIAGKNPITHVGKLYNVAAMRIAESIVAELEDVGAADVFLVSRIGAPITEPQLVHLRLRGRGSRHVGAWTPRATEVARRHLAALDSLWPELLARNLATGEASGESTPPPDPLGSGAP